MTARYDHIGSGYATTRREIAHGALRSLAEYDAGSGSA
jgi:hypothetical protein